MSLLTHSYLRPISKEYLPVPTRHIPFIDWLTAVSVVQFHVNG